MRFLRLFGLVTVACAGRSGTPTSSEMAGSASVGEGATPSESCVAAYEGVLAVGAVVFGVEGRVWGDAERLEILPHSADRTGAGFRQRNRLHTSQGIRQGFDLFDCSDGPLRYVGFEMDEESLRYDYQPGLFWPETPLVEGTTWSETGVMMLTTLDGEPVEEPLRSGRVLRVLAQETLRTPAGPLETFSIRRERTDEGHDQPNLVITDWFLLDAPMVLVQREQRIETSPGEFVSGTLRLLSIENPPESANPS